MLKKNIGLHEIIMLKNQIYFAFVAKRIVKELKINVPSEDI